MIARGLRLRQAWWLLLSSFGAALAMTACSSSDDVSPSPGASADDAGQTDAASTPESDGAIDSGEIDVETPSYDFAVTCTAVPCVTRIAARGGAHACAVLQSGSVRCWGANASGQAGKGDDTGVVPAFVATPTEVATISGAVAVSATGDGTSGTTCVVSGGGAVSCFGSDASGQLGRGAAPSTTPHPEPVELADVRAKSVTLGGTFAFAIGTDDRLWSWGANEGYQLARPTAADAGVASTPALAETITFAPRSCAGTSTTSFVVSANGELVSWGGGTLETLGRLSSLTRDPAPAAMALSEVERVTAGATHACALRRSRVYCWGKNEHGQLGSGTLADAPLPARVVLPKGVLAVDVVAGGDNTCVIASSGDVYCWGANESSQVGANARVDPSTPHRVDGITEQAVALGVMERSVCALLRSGAVTCWGDNLLGQLGRGARDLERHAPGPVLFQ
jgi:alpha-tubulin suppressor-like RCC1 family protein